MKTLFLLIISIIPSVLFAQSDMLMLKKNNKVIQTFFPNSDIMFSTESGYREAHILDIKRDSLFLVQYDVRTVMTNLGVYMLDTVAAYRSAIRYNEITGIGKKSSGFSWRGSGAALFGGGTVLTVAGLVTWILAKPNTRYYARPELVIGAAILAGVGYLMMKSSGRQMKIGKKYSLQYISTH